jgi:acid phosphatase type 7
MRRFVSLFAAFLAAGTLALGAAGKLVGGPMVVNAKPTSATVVWVVQSGEGSDLRVETKALAGLTPGAIQHYDVNGTDSGRGSFQTPPTKAEPFEFVVFGDTRTRHDMHRRVVEAILKDSSPEFVIHTGDLVSNGTDAAQWPVFFEIETELLRKVAFFPALGNHERNSPRFYEFFQVGLPYYSFDWGTSHFIVLNSDIGNAAADTAAKEAFWDRQRRWFEEDLKQSQGSDFRFVTAHHPPFTAVSSRQGGNPEMAALVPLFEKYHVSAGFFGHDHNYQHHLKNNVHYVVSGGGGAPLYDVNSPVPGITRKVSSVEHFVKIRMNGKSARLTAIALDGSTLDEFEISR